MLGKPKVLLESFKLLGMPNKTVISNFSAFLISNFSEFAPHCRLDTRNNLAELKNPFHKTNMGQKIISYIGPSLWNSLPDSIKKANTLNTFKDNVKKHYLT